MRATWAKAASVWRTSGWPASGWYCLGCALPARAPWPAHGSSAWQRAASIGAGAAGMAGAIVVRSAACMLCY